MNVALWIAQIVLAVVFLAAGSIKLVRSKDRLPEQMKWAEGFSQNSIRAIGTLEVLGAVGLILPAVIGIAPVLVPLAAVGLALTQVGAIIVNIRIANWPEIITNAVLIAVALFVAWGRFGDYAL